MTPAAVVLQYGSKQITLPMTNTERGSIGYLVACGAIVAALVAMGIDNNRQLARCESAGRSAAECRLVVLGR